MLTQLANAELSSLFMVKVNKVSSYEMKIPEDLASDVANTTNVDEEVQNHRF